MTPPKRDLSLQSFGRLFVIYNTSGRKWWCHCECGNFVEVFASNLTRGHTQSCGCLCKERTSQARRVHGDSHHTKDTPYGTWQHMRDRCLNPTSDKYKWYMGKGIDICTEWEDYKAFKAWALSHGWRIGLTIERVDPEKGYFPENCEWITKEENSRRRQNVHY